MSLCSYDRSKKKKKWDIYFFIAISSIRSIASNRCDLFWFNLIWNNKKHLHFQLVHMAWLVVDRIDFTSNTLCRWWKWRFFVVRNIEYATQFRVHQLIGFYFFPLKDQERQLGLWMTQHFNETYKLFSIEFAFWSNETLNHELVSVLFIRIKFEWLQTNWNWIENYESKTVELDVALCRITHFRFEGCFSVPIDQNLDAHNTSSVRLFWFWTKSVDPMDSSRAYVKWRAD